MTTDEALRKATEVATAASKAAQRRGAMEKSSNHAKITGDFGEALVRYWLSKHGYECAWVDHTGIDLIAWTKDGSQRMGISVQCRSCYPGAEKRAVSLHQFEQARVPCNSLGLIPYAAIVVDGGAVDFLRCFLLPLEHLEKIAGGKKPRLWPMTERFLEPTAQNRFGARALVSRDRHKNRHSRSLKWGQSFENKQRKRRGYAV